MAYANGSAEAFLIEEVDQIVSNEMPTVQFLRAAVSPKWSLVHGYNVMVICEP
jgi:hypothetical protein